MQQRRRVRHSKGGVSFVRFEGFVRETRHAARARRDLANSGARPELEHIGHRTNMMKMTAFAFCNVISMTWSIAKSSMHFFCALLVRVRSDDGYRFLTCFHVVQQRLPSRGRRGDLGRGGARESLLRVHAFDRQAHTVQGTDVQHAFMADTPFRTPRSARGAPPPPLSARSYGTLPSARSSYGSTSHGRTPRQKIPIAIPVVTTNNTRAPNPRRLYPMPKSSRPTDVYEEWAQGGANPEIPVRACKSHVCL